MCRLNQLGVLVFVASPFVSVVSFAQSPVFDPGALPISLSPNQMESLTNLTPRLPSGSVRSPAHRRRPAAVRPVLSPEQIGYRETIRTLGKDDHHFVHVELTNGKVQTGAIISIDDHGFQLRSGIFDSIHISYFQLKEQPRRVPAVGTHMVNGLKWGSLVVLAIPVIILFLPLAAMGLMPDC